MLFNLVFASNTIFCALFSFFLNIELDFLTSAVIAQTFNPTVEREIPIRMATNKEKAEIETYPGDSRS